MGPMLEISKQTHREKHRGIGESFEEAVNRQSSALSDDEEHRLAIKDCIGHQRFLLAGRVQLAIGSPRLVTAFNCFVSQTIQDSMRGIMDAATNAALTMKLGGGIGYDFSTLRYRGSDIVTIDSHASGAVSFMNIFDAVCSTVASAGNRRGAQMGVLRIDHPDIEEFVRAKQNNKALTNFNISVAVTDKFMKALKSGDTFDLVWEGKVVKTIDPSLLWDEIMRGTWDYAEPGVLFIDTINKENNLSYCETISATNPCGEQPLPPYGACLLGSWNCTKYVYSVTDEAYRVFDLKRLRNDIKTMTRALDNVIDRTTYPLPEQEDEAKNKRRIGMGVTGLANAIESMGFPYGSEDFIHWEKIILKTIRDTAYETSVQLSKEKGCFPMFSDSYLDSPFIKRLPKGIREGIKQHGIRNSHLTSIAPAGTISLTADNVSSSLEPVFAYKTNRAIKMIDGDKIVEVPDYGYRVFDIKGKTAEQVTVQEHLDVLLAAQPFVDSAISKTCNVGSEVTWLKFKDIYMKAWEGGAKGITTFRPDGKRFGILEAVKEGEACVFDPDTGRKTCE